MSMSPDTASAEENQGPVTELFDDYAAAYDDYDAEGIADCFAYPCTIWQLGKGNVFADEEELLENIEALLAVLEREEVVATRYEVLHQAVSGNTAHATLQWTQAREDGETALMFVCHYLLIHDDGEWVIATIVND